jgi:hypothetical protein
MSKRRSAALIGVLLLVGGLAWLVWSFHERVQNRLTVENCSGQPLSVLRVTVGGETLTFTDVPENAEVTGSFPIKSDDHFSVEGRLADGRRVGGEFGYVTNGMSGQWARFVVGPAGQIEFDQSTSVAPY